MKNTVTTNADIKLNKTDAPNSKKHAYLIIAHNQFELLKMLCSLLDSVHNDFYILIDKKVKDFDQNLLKDSIHTSKVYYVDRINVTWGDFSQIQAELTLLKAAVPNKYSYYHLLSGVDLPLKTADEIYDFFESHSGKEFVHFSDKTVTESAYCQDRIKYYYRHNKKYIILKRYTKLGKIDLRIQSILGLDRRKKYENKFYYGSNWFSITNACAEYALSKIRWTNKFLSYSFCADELWLQTIVYNSDFRNNLYDASFTRNHRGNMRAIDFERGCPYTYLIGDFDDLIHSDFMFARKFNMDTDAEICYKIRDYLKNKAKCE